eukprot:120599-Amphidinium_carterae.2
MRVVCRRLQYWQYWTSRYVILPEGVGTQVRSPSQADWTPCKHLTLETVMTRCIESQEPIDLRHKAAESVIATSNPEAKYLGACTAVAE